MDPAVCRPTTGTCVITIEDVLADYPDLEREDPSGRIGVRRIARLLATLAAQPLQPRPRLALRATLFANSVCGVARQHVEVTSKVVNEPPRRSRARHSRAGQVKVRDRAGATKDSVTLTRSVPAS